MLVPKAAMNKYQLPVFGEHNVRFARKSGIMESEAIPHAVDDGANYNLRFRVFSTNFPHYLTAFVACKNVCHYDLARLSLVQFDSENSVPFRL